MQATYKDVKTLGQDWYMPVPMTFLTLALLRFFGVLRFVASPLTASLDIAVFALQR